MKIIDLYLAIERNKNIPKNVVYKYKIYRYYPEYKQYFREEYGDKISLFLEANSEEDRVYTLEDTPKEDKKIEKLDTLVLSEYFTNNELAAYIFETQVKINEMIDKIKGKDNE